LAFRLVARLADLYPDSAHVRDFGLERGDDEPVWMHAQQGSFIIVTKGDDFRQRSFLFGPPPKVIWVRLGNCTTADVEALLRARYADVSNFSPTQTRRFFYSHAQLEYSSRWLTERVKLTREDISI
jgi:predicted nuclease of predicted toxin-antitoxin system